MFEQRVNSDVLTVSTVNSQDQVTQKPLRDSVKQALKNYFAQLNGQDVNDLYELVLAEVEQPLLDMVMQYTSCAAYFASKDTFESRNPLERNILN